MDRKRWRGVRLTLASMGLGLFVVAALLMIAPTTQAWTPDDNRVQFRSRLDAVVEPELPPARALTTTKDQQPIGQLQPELPGKSPWFPALLAAAFGAVGTAILSLLVQEPAFRARIKLSLGAATPVGGPAIPALFFGAPVVFPWVSGRPSGLEDTDSEGDTGPDLDGDLKAPPGESDKGLNGDTPGITLMKDKMGLDLPNIGPLRLPLFNDLKASKDHLQELERAAGQNDLSGLENLWDKELSLTKPARSYQELKSIIKALARGQALTMSGQGGGDRWGDSENRLRRILNWMQQRLDKLGPNPQGIDRVIAELKAKGLLEKWVQEIGKGEFDRVLERNGYPPHVLGRITEIRLAKRLEEQGHLILALIPHTTNHGADVIAVDRENLVVVFADAKGSLARTEFEKTVLARDMVPVVDQAINLLQESGQNSDAFGLTQDERAQVLANLKDWNFKVTVALGGNADMRLRTLDQIRRATMLSSTRIDRIWLDDEGGHEE